VCVDVFNEVAAVFVVAVFEVLVLAVVVVVVKEDVLLVVFERTAEFTFDAIASRFLDRERAIRGLHDTLPPYSLSS
jgi:hypothetical protein